jgi:hypothetical protein
MPPPLPSAWLAQSLLEIAVLANVSTLSCSIAIPPPSPPASLSMTGAIDGETVQASNPPADGDSAAIVAGVVE